MLHALPHSIALLLWVLVKTSGRKGVQKCFSLFRPKLVHHITTTTNNKKTCNRNSRQKAPPQSMLVARMQV